MNQFLPRAISQGRAALFHSAAPGHNLIAFSSRLPILHAASFSQAAQQTPKSSQQTHSQPPIPPPSKSPEELASLSFIVRRTPSTQLPIYRRWMSGGNRQVVLIKKIDGDRRKMLEDIAESLGIGREEGNHFDKARSWLLQRGF
ncbi:hypothetical protein TOPH_06056 [Tolypocladium ophioglossoides CBS 100239]|uniref:Large ribosomal subunit protein mL49 n=1 Tax=Tolypocladium ophioglossoides (strain CBS 100239) TaxID=1163406 RepID=A0A0L0N5U5_TOLOC|nr:hypothetical protein TOPH_06056 [Tolypocladium ophioglossoides CBS 100239]